MAAGGDLNAATNQTASKASLTELAGLFLRLGTTALGGLAAPIAMMEDQVVRRLGWLVLTGAVIGTGVYLMK